MSPERFILLSMLLSGLSSPGWREANTVSFSQLVRLSETPMDIAANMTPSEAVTAADKLERLRAVQWEVK